MYNKTKQGGKFMKIAIPTIEGRLCAHFGHCEEFSFAEVNPETAEILKISTDVPEGGFSFIEIDEETKKILKIEEKQPEEDISCQSASWVANQGVDLILAGGMGGRPMMMLEQFGIQVISGCPEMEIEQIVRQFLDNELVIGENSCNHGEGHVCHGHGEGHHCGGHH